MKKFSYILFLCCSFAFSQEKDKALIQANDLIYDANEIVSEDFLLAETEYRKAISKKPTNSKGSYNLGNAYFNSGLYDEGLLRHIEAAESATTKKEKHRAFHNIGNALMKQNLCKDAVEAFKNALRNEPSDEETRYNLGLAKICAEKQKDEQDKNKDDKDKKEDKKDQDKKDGDDKKDQDKKDQGDKDKK